VQPNQATGTDNIDLNKLKIILYTKWFWLLLIFVSINTGAFLFLRYTKNLYQSESQLKLDVKKEATEFGIRNVLQEGGNNIMSGEIELIQSKLFLSQVLDASKFEISFYSVGRFLNEELFRGGPVYISILNPGHSLYNVPITFEELDQTSFRLSTANRNEVEGQYGKPVTLADLSLILYRDDKFHKGDEVGYFFQINSREVLLDYLSSNLTVEPLNISANTIRLAFKDYNPLKAQAVLHKIDSMYIGYSYQQKNLANKQKIDWVVNELSVLEKKMEEHEDYFENFTLKNKTSDLDEDLKRTIIAINAIDSQRFNFSKKIGEADFLISSLRKGQPVYSVHLHDNLPADINQQLSSLQQYLLDQDKLKMSHTEIAFAYRQKQKEIENLQKKTLSQLEELKSEWKRRLIEVDKQKNRLETQFASLPDKSTEYSKRQRFYKLYEEFYLTLMQSKSEFEIAQAGSTPDFKVLSPASFPVKPISPKRAMIAGIGVVASLVLIFFFVGIVYLLNNKITNLYEVEKITSIPFLGSIPQSSYTNGSLHVLDHPKSMVSESIRSLRTNLDFFNISADRKVISVSSTVSGEGKSFIAINLGGAIAMSNKKVLLIDLDMRKTKSAMPESGDDATKGVSTVLIKKNTWKECVLATQLSTLDFMPSGPHPPNPSELLLNGEFTQLIAELKGIYDCIILDTPPVGLVTDGIMAMKLSDISIYVFRANYSKKEFLSTLQRIANINKFSNITTVLNAIPGPAKTYGYGYYEENFNSKKFKPLRKLKSIFK
jgi:capsular exopolysaccharide synthesis family protein